jgi:formate hydrogenlyase transcriptional activator
VMPFDGISHFDAAVNWVQWNFVEPYNKEFEAFIARPLPKEETVAWCVYRNQQPVIMRLTDPETFLPHLVERLTKLGMNSLCALPLSTADRRLGNLAFVSHLEDAYSTEDERFLSLVANQIAVAMDDARAQQRLRLLLDLTNRVVAKLDLRDLLHEISATVRELMQCDAVAVALPDPENGELHVYAKDSPGQRETIKSAHRPDFAEHVFRTGQVTNLTKEQLAADSILAAKGLNSLCGLPLFSRGRVLGVLSAGSTRENAFTEDDLSFVSSGEFVGDLASVSEPIP